MSQIRKDIHLYMRREGFALKRHQNHDVWVRSFITVITPSSPGDRKRVMNNIKRNIRRAEHSQTARRSKSVRKRLN
jgi:hypothetical protein